MKKLSAILFMSVICAALAGCNGQIMQQTEEETPAPWVAEGAARIGKDLGCGEFSINGKVFSFPMSLSEWLESGWHIADNYENRDEFELEPYSLSTEFRLTNAAENVVIMSVMNDTEESRKIEDCTVYSVSFPLYDCEAVLPGGLYCDSTLEELTALYGEAGSKEETASGYRPCYQVEIGGRPCSVEFQVTGSDVTMVSRVVYELLDAEEVWEVQNRKSIEEFCAKYVDAALKASFHGDWEEYVDMKSDTQEGAEGLYNSEVSYYSQTLLAFVDVNVELIEEESIVEYVRIAKDVLKKTKWEIGDVTIDPETMKGTMEMVLYPTNYIDLIDTPVDEVIAEFQKKYKKVNFDKVKEKKRREIEQDYSEMILEVLQSKVNLTAAGKGIKKKFDIDYSDGILSSDAWNEIDDIIMGMSE